MERALFFPGVTDSPTVGKKLGRLGLRPSDLKRLLFGNGGALAVLKKRVRVKLPEALLADEHLIEEIHTVDRFVRRQQELIEYERKAEIERQISEIKGFSGKERELFGRAILDLRGRREGERFGLSFVRFGRDREIRTEIASGDVVLVSRGDPLKSDLVGTVSEVRRRYIVVAFDAPPPKWALRDGVRIDLYVNDVTFKRMVENLETLRHIQGPSRDLRNIALGLASPRTPETVPLKPIGPTLNESQNEAVSLALGSAECFLVHGPPGTGKTSTLTELILQLVRQGYKVLATADSNTAVDNLLLRLSRFDLDLVRVGHPARILDDLHRFSLPARLEAHPGFQAVRKGWEDFALLVRERDRFSKPTPARTRGMSRERIRRLAEEGRGMRGVGADTIRSMAEWIRRDETVEAEAQRLRANERELIDGIVKGADVVLATNAMVLSDALRDRRFDIAVIDEGSQQVIPSTLIPLMHADRFVIAGDHRQLPPTVVSEQARELRRSLFESLIERHPDNARMLRVQYRMHEKIMAFPARTFYDGALVADESVRTRTLRALDPRPPRRYAEILDPDEPLIFVSTHGIEAAESLPWRSTSYENPAEARIVLDLLGELLAMGIDPAQIGVISPYLSQVKRIKAALTGKLESVEVKSVDGFQGREKEVILISFVRSNPSGDLGFLGDLRRLNVALTRPRAKLIAVGDARTLQIHPVYREFIDFVRHEGRFVSVRARDSR
ncbi:IGHMBP2 family helicase [Nitratifractor sp.]